MKRSILLPLCTVTSPNPRRHSLALFLTHVDTHTSPLASLPGVRGEQGMLIRVIIRTPLLNITPALCVRAAAVRLFYDTWQSVQACKCQVCSVSDQRPCDRGTEKSQHSLCPLNTQPSLATLSARSAQLSFLYIYGGAPSQPGQETHSHMGSAPA